MCSPKGEIPVQIINDVVREGQEDPDVAPASDEWDDIFATGEKMLENMHLG